MEYIKSQAKVHRNFVAVSSNAPKVLEQDEKNIFSFALSLERYDRNFVADRCNTSLYKA